MHYAHIRIEHVDGAYVLTRPRGWERNAQEEKAEQESRTRGPSAEGANKQLNAEKAVSCLEILKGS